MNDIRVTNSPRPGAEAGDKLRYALLDSRQRWHDLVTMAADLAFETDAQGRIIVIAHPGVADSCAGAFVDSTKRRTSSTEARLALAVLTSERNAA